jgi:putative Ca2+/H+ antiporter (TMEM165/GDT1 family)
MDRLSNHRPVSTQNGRWPDTRIICYFIHWTGWFMDLKLAATVFGVVFLAELGDKTQLATLLFSAKSPENLIAVFLGASIALILASALGVAAGGLVAQYISPKLLSYGAGTGFIVIGAWTIWQSAVNG